MHPPEELQRLVEKEISGIAFPGNPVELYDPIRYVLEVGGKRLRPVLALMAADLFCDDIRIAIRPALGIEVFHNFTLLHDDIMDRSDLRRNKPTVHKKWNENTAILSGDAMLIHAYSYFFDVHPLSVLKLFNKTALEVCEGQQYDMNFESCTDVSADEYIQMIGLKTAVLIAASMQIGALVAGASEKDAALLYQFGHHIGLAFQLQDDYLDTFGNVEKFGKAIGNDIVANKKTFLLIKARELATGQIMEELSYWISSVSPDRDEKVKAITSVYRKLNIDVLSREKMYSYLRAGINCLEKVQIESAKKDLLKNYAVTLLDREK